jgi:hypothetical protein
LVKEFRISATSDKFWNKDFFVKFLFENHCYPIHLKIDPEAICLNSLGVYDMLESFNCQHVTIITRNPLESHPRYQIKLIENQWLPITQKIDHNLHSWSGLKIFNALFGRPTAARLGIGSYLWEKHRDKSHLHFSADPHIDNLEQFEFDKLLHYDVPSVERAGNLLAKLPMLLSSTDRYTAVDGYDYGDPLTDFYRDIFVDIVVESHILGNTFFVTEKTLRSIWLKKPFIVFASRDYLCYLRQMGFKTFFEFWDEDYDGYETRDRLLKIYTLIDWIAKQDSNSLLKMYESMQEILENNYHVLLSKSYKTEIMKIVN